MTSRQFKDDLYSQFARVGKAVSNPHRLELLDLLAQGDRRVDDLANQANLSIANASQHLQVLRRAGLVEARRHGTAMYYRLAGDDVLQLWRAIRGAGERRLAEIDQLSRSYLSNREHFEAIDAETLWKRIELDDVTVIDVRPRREYEAAHLPGARSIPIDELESRLAELPDDEQIVAYCRGPYCVYADEAVSLLSKMGFQAARLTDGLPEWRLAGLPIE